MAIIITDECINCGACIQECPNNAIYDQGDAWKYEDGTKLKGIFKDHKGQEQHAEELHDAVSEEFIYIVPSKCTECIGFHEQPQCAAVCPIDCCVPDENNVETQEELLKKKEIMHQE